MLNKVGLRLCDLTLARSRNLRSEFLNIPLDREGVDGVAVAAIKIANHFELSIVPPPSCNSSGAKKGPGRAVTSRSFSLPSVMDSKQPI